MSEITPPLKLKYRTPIKRLLKRSGIDPPEGTWTYTIGVSSKRAKKGGHSGGVGRKFRRSSRWPPGLRQRRKAI